MRYLVFFSLFLGLLGPTARGATLEEVSQSPYWKLLLHYRDGWFGDSSEADGKDFFISPQGRRDPLAELSADIQAFSDPKAPTIGHLHQHPQCAFPERYRFLKSQVDFKSVSLQCPDFAQWKKQFRAKSLTLIFAAPYLGSPASMFGHTFLRIDSEARSGFKKNDLLDFGISFEAVTGQDFAGAYVIKGLLGFYPGVFTQNAFYLKVNTYTNMESRDLWEYELNLTPEQVDHFLNHLWEMGTTSFGYYFFNRNCSYHLLSLLEVANPTWNLRSQFGPMAIPVDTVRAITSISKAVKKVTVRPALLKLISAQVDHMSDSERERFYTLQGQVSLVEKTDSVTVLDALMDWQKYQAMTGSLTANEAEKKIDQHLLSVRAKAPQGNEEDLSRIVAHGLETQGQPQEGHLSSKLSLSGGSDNSVAFFGVEFRPAFHDLLDSDTGYLPRSSLVVARARGSFLTGGYNKLRLDDLTLGEVTNFYPISRLLKPFSWRLSGGFTRPLDLGCLDCAAGNVEGGLGWTVEPFSLFSVTGLITGHGEVSNAYDRFNNQFYRLGPGLFVEALIPVSKKIKLAGSYEHIRYLPGIEHFVTKIEGGLSFALDRYEIRTLFDWFNSSMAVVNYASFNASYYF